MRALLACSLLGLLANLAHPLSGSAASFTPLGGVPVGSGDSEAQAVSADGSTVVGRSHSAPGYEAFVWDATNGIQGLGFLHGVVDGPSSHAIGVSADGSTVVGSSGDLFPVGPEAFVWDSSNGMRGLGVLPGGSFESRAFAVSADGSTVVGESNSVAVSEAFVWDATNGMRGLGDLPEGAFFSTARGVSADGSIVVGRGVSRSDFFEAFIWDAANGMQGLGFLPGGSGSEAFAVSADGSTVVGQAQSFPSDEPFLWDATNGMQGLGFLPGGREFGRALSVSADGSIVVGFVGAAADASTLTQAFVWDKTNGMQSLEVMLTELGLDLTGWQLAEATGISDDGRTIVGYGRNPIGRREAFIVFVPEPDPTLLLSVLPSC